MDSIYPAGPTGVPERFTEPTSAYRRHAWLAVAGLGGFVAVYLALTVWFSWTAYRLLSSVFRGSSDGFSTLVVGICAALLAAFMLKALFFVKHGYEINDIEITAQQHPQLFAFLQRLADEAKAPRAHRVFLSPRVNAAVFYDLSIVNLIFPSKKNLEIGLGLVNALTLGELKAVLAHEFGHFGQRSMAVGRWVYVAQQIAAHIVAKRDVLDAFLQRLNRFDLRLAWIGWILTLIIWSLRSVTETLFRVVVISQRALAREMEFQADLVSVSLTGSDALIHALHRLQVADEAWARAVNFAASEAQAGRRVQDIFAIQTAVTEHLRRIFGEGDYGLVPPVPASQPEAHRLFKTQLAQPPQMWSTHPTNCDRENNAKRTYIAAPIDERSAWDVFDDVQGLKERMSAHIIQAEKAEAVPPAESLKRIDEQYGRTFLDKTYRGAYLGRSVVRDAARPSELYGPTLEPQQLMAALDALYPESLAQDLEQLRNLEQEVNALEALQKGVMDAPGGVIRHRGRELKRDELPAAIAELRSELSTVRGRVGDHDRRCRTAHLSAAAQLGNGWQDYLRGLGAILHYADHAEANLRDVARYLGNVFAVVTADGRVSGSELSRLIGAANRVHDVLYAIYQQAQSIVLDETLARKFGVESFAECLGTFELARAGEGNIREWLNVIDSWVGSAAGTLSGLGASALEILLITEADVARWCREGIAPDAAPAPSIAPERYDTLRPGSERQLETRLDWWDRFQVADGTAATIARLAVAAGIVGAVLMVGGAIGESYITIYNGLGRAVHVYIGDRDVVLEAFSKTQFPVSHEGSYLITARTLQGVTIESFEQRLAGDFDRYVYNIAGAGPLLEWTAVYGNVSAQPERPLGTPRWLTTDATVLFEEPPKSVQTEGGGATREVLSGFGDASPFRAVALLKPGDDAKAMVSVHTRWDDLESKHILNWFAMAEQDDALAETLRARLAETPRHPLLLRLEQDRVQTNEEREAVCVRHRSLAEASAGSPDLQYIADRCIPDETMRDEAFIAHYRAAPDNGWLAYAAGYTFQEQSQWQEAVQALDTARRKLPPIADSAVTDLARIRRLTQGTGANLKDLASESESLQRLVALETGEEVSGSFLAYRSLSMGRLEDALKRASGTPQLEDRVIRFAAASEGASAEIIAKALTLKFVEDDLDGDVAWAMLGLAAREQRDLSPYLSIAARSSGFEPDALRRLVDAAAKDPAAVDKMLDHVHPAVRARAYVLGTIIRGKTAPGNWREGAKRLLFSPERPYFM